MRTFAPALAAALLAASPTARGVFPLTALKPICLKQIHSPTTITHAPDGSGRLFVCDQMGKIFIIQSGMMLPTPFLNISSSPAPNNGPGPVVPMNLNYNERGLLGLAFHPGYANPLSPGFRKFYVNYNKAYQAGIDPTPPQVGDPVDCATVIAEFEVSATDPNVAVLASERRLLVFTQPQSNHNGGQLEFGPDGFLYIGSGDGGSSNDNNAGHVGGTAISPRPTDNLGNGQEKTRYLGKILRIDPLDPDGAGPLTYSIPGSNPFFNDATPGLKKEIYAFGLRNPWKFSFDKRAGGTNRLFCGDVGQGRIEEINLIVSGGNYGWRYKEGVELPSFSSGSATNPMPDPGGPHIDPIAMYAHPGVTTNPVLPQLGLSVTGGFVYRGAAIPALQGKYIFGDYGSTSGASDGRMMGLEETAPGSGVFTLTQAIPLTAANPIVGQRILCLGEDESGEIYVGLKTNAGVLALGPDNLPAGGIYKIVPPQTFTTTLQSAKDNTIFAEDVPLARSYSNGIGYLYSGRTGQNFGPYVRRALVAFDLAAEVPTLSVVQSAQLKLLITRAGPSANRIFNVHRLSETWGEGTSKNTLEPNGGGYGAVATTNDATWLRRFFNTATPAWLTAGGSFAATASATSTQNGSFVTWSSSTHPQLKTDVQGWVTDPASNAGWIIRGDETTNETACQFSSRQEGGVPPALEITYDSFPALTHREVWLQTYFPVGKFVDGAADLDGDGLVNKFEYAFTFSPLAKSGPSGTDTATQVSAEVDGENFIFTINFRRDPRATELTYILETSSDLVNWTPLVTSVGGAEPTGSGYVTENDVIGEEPVRLVTGRQTVPNTENRYARVRILP